MNKLYLGADVGGTKIAFYLRDHDGKTVWQNTIPALNTVDGLFLAILDAAKDADVSLDRITALGLGLPGCVDQNGYDVYDVPTFGWKNVDLRSLLFSRLPFPCTASNDVNTALLGERAEGEARDVDNAVFISIGTGLGGAVLANGRIISGSRGLAGEIGYFVESTDAQAGKKFTADAYGALESVCSGTGLDTLGRPYGLSARNLFSKANDNDGQAQDILRGFLDRLAVTAANCASLLNPEKIIFGGGLSTELPPYLEILKDKVSSLTPISTHLCISALGRNAGVVGACHLARCLAEGKNT